MNRSIVLAAGAAIAWAVYVPQSQAEPHLAVRHGYACVTCHVNPTGGGMRNQFGAIFARNVLPARTLDAAETSWTGSINRFVAAGGNVRAQWTATDVPNQSQSNEFDLADARLFLLVEPIPGRVSLYLDERVAPGAATAMEAYVRARSADGHWFAQVGRMYLPFGLRIEDDTAFTRRVPGINMTTPDDGVQVGWESGPWSLQLAASNGGGGGPETDADKQWTGQAAYFNSRFRLGLAASANTSDAGDRTAVSVFGGLRTGPVAWLGEWALVDDGGFQPEPRTLVAALLEANWLVARGHNLRLAGEWQDPDREVDEDGQTRWSVVYEYTPVQFLQLRAGARIYDGIPQSDLQNARTAFLEAHGYF